jgi:hypothetical protein
MPRVALRLLFESVSNGAFVHMAYIISKILKLMEELRILK